MFYFKNISWYLSITFIPFIVETPLIIINKCAFEINEGEKFELSAR